MICFCRYINSQKEPEPKSKQLPLIPINVKPDIEVKNNFVADDNVETKPDVKNCLFVPRGDTVQSCIDRCQFIEDRHLWGGSNCTNDNAGKGVNFLNIFSPAMLKNLGVLLTKKRLFASELTNFTNSCVDFLLDKGGCECSGLLHFTIINSPKFI
mgnify:CR=1 FL=1